MSPSLSAPLAAWSQEILLGTFRVQPIWQGFECLDTGSASGYANVCAFTATILPTGRLRLCAPRINVTRELDLFTPAHLVQAAIALLEMGLSYLKWLQAELYRDTPVLICLVAARQARFEQEAQRWLAQLSTSS